MRVLYIPVDSRPCNLRFPSQIAQMAGGELILPEEMDYFAQPADFEALRAFLEREAPTADHLILSVDHWCYGSLLASRTDAVTIETARERMAILAGILARHPRLRVWAFSVIMRSSISTMKKEDVPYYHLMTEFSQQWYRARQCPAEEEKLAQLRAQIPDRIVEQYFNVRARNHEINMECARWTMAGRFEKLLLLMEDSQEFGFHTVEQQEIRELIGDAPNIHIHNGTDEGGMMLTAVVMREQDAPLKMRTVYLQGDKETFWALLEDRPFYQNVDSQCESIGIEQVTEGEECILCIVLPADNQETDVSAPPPVSPECVRRITQELDTGKPVALLDVQCMNCGDLSLLRALGRENIFRLSGYAAWNTASNALGTALSQLRAQREPFGEASRTFLIERLLDDALYQGDVRQRVQERLQAQGEDVYHLTDKRGAEEMLRETFVAAMAEDPSLGFDGLRAAVSLPWDRTFEADIRLEKEQ